MNTRRGGDEICPGGTSYITGACIDEQPTLAKEWAVEQSEFDPDDGTPGNTVGEAGVIDDGGSYDVVSVALDRPYRCVFNPVS